MGNFQVSHLMSFPFLGLLCAVRATVSVGAGASGLSLRREPSGWGLAKRGHQEEGLWSPRVPKRDLILPVGTALKLSFCICEVGAPSGTCHRWEAPGAWPGTWPPLWGCRFLRGRDDSALRKQEASTHLAHLDSPGLQGAEWLGHWPHRNSSSDLPLAAAGSLGLSSPSDQLRGGAGSLPSSL